MIAIRKTPDRPWLAGRLAGPLVTALSLLLPGPAWAQGLAMPRALEGLSPAGAMCLRDPINSSGKTGLAELPAADLSCMMSAPALAKLLMQPAKEGRVLVDLRRPDPQAAALPESIQSSIAGVLSKPYLKAQTVVLVDDGHVPETAYSQCARLKAAGFRRVWVLQGGAPSWAQSQLVTQTAKVLNDAPSGAARTAPAPLSAAQLWANSSFQANVVVAQADSGLQAHLPYVQAVPQLTLDSVRGALAQHRRAFGKQVPVAALVLALHEDDQRSQAQLAQWRQALHPLPVLAYVGRPDALGKSLAQQQAIWRAHERGPRALGCGL